MGGRSLYVITSPAVRAETLRFERKGVQAVIKDVFLPWLNAFRFFEQQAKRWEVRCCQRQLPAVLSRH